MSQKSKIPTKKRCSKTSDFLRRAMGLIWRMALPCKLSLPFLFGIIRQKFPDNLRGIVFIGVVRDEEVI